jgi:hypothetical protein
MPIENITFDNIQLETKTGFTLKDAKDIEFHNVTVNTESGPVITATTTEGLEIDGVKTTKPHARTPVIDLGKVKRVFVRGCTAVPETETFLRVDENSVDEIALEGNNLKAAKTAVEKATDNSSAN